MIRQDNGAIRIESSDLLSTEAQPIVAALRHTYHEVRFAKAPYPFDLGTYDRAVEHGTGDKTLPDSGLNSDQHWVVRGAPGCREVKRHLRLSMNVALSPALLRQIDGWMLDERLPAHYKFPAPRLAHEVPVRHDSVTVFIPEETGRPAINRLAERVTPYIRGDALVGEKIVPGVRLLSSIPAGHLHGLVRALDSQDPPAAEAIRFYASRAFRNGGAEPQPCPPGVHAAILAVLENRGFTVSYRPDSGYSLARREA